MAGGIDASIPLGVKPPDTMSTIGSIVGIAKGATELQRSKVALEQDTGALEARKGIAEIMKDERMLDPATGMLDLNKFAAAAQRIDPKNYVWQDVLTKTAKVNDDLMKVKMTAMKLGDEQSNFIGQRLATLAADPNTTTETVLQTLGDLETVAPGSKPMADVIRGYVSKATPETLRPILARFRNMALPVAAQVPNATAFQTGTGVDFGNTNPAAGPVGAGTLPGSQPIPNKVPLQAQEEQAADLVGNPYIRTRDASTGQVGAKPMPGARGPAPLLAFPPGESPESAAALSKAREASNKVAANIPEQRFNNAQIIKLADGAMTGAGAGKINSVLSAAGLQALDLTPDGAVAKTAENTQKLGHFLTLQSMNYAKAMGLNTDQARGGAEQATASREWNPPAIKSGTKILDAFASGYALFNEGLEKAINSPDNQKSIFAARDFQNAWSQSFDPNAMRLLNAMEAGDKAEKAAIFKEVGGEGSAGAKALAAKVRALGNLVTTGRP